MLFFMGIGISQADCERLIDQVNADGSGALSWTEFLEIMSLVFPEKRLKLSRVFYEPAEKFLEFTLPDIDGFIKTFRRFDIDGPKISFLFFSVFFCSEEIFLK
jgi:Ca2+-binding EF-hand superfamily protein